MLPLTMLAVFCIRPVGLRLSETPNSDELLDLEEENPTEVGQRTTKRAASNSLGGGNAEKKTSMRRPQAPF